MPEVQDLFRSPSYRYFYKGKKSDRYFWTTEKVSYKGGSCYKAGIYKYISKGRYKLIKSLPYDLRREAKADALKWYNKSLEK